MMSEKFKNSYQEFIEKFVRQFEDQQKVKINNYEIENNVIKGGCNFLSIILRLQMEYSKEGEKSLNSVIIKIPELSTEYEKFSSHSNIYLKEVYMYEEVLPKLHEFCTGELPTPTGYKINGSQALVLEDLYHKGYRQKSKLDRLDLQQSMVALRTISQFHALGIKYRETYEEDNTIMIDTIVPVTNDNFFYNYHKHNYEKFLEVVQRIDSEDIYNKLQNCYKNPWETIFQKKFDSSEFNVLLHGDLWIKNMMFWHDDMNYVQKIKILDLQFCHWGSPIIDLIRFFVSTVQFEVFENHYEFMVQFYVNNLNDILCELKCDKKYQYSESEIWKDLGKHKYLWISIIGTLLALSLSDNETLFDENGKPCDIHSSDLYKSNLLNWLAFLKNKVLL